MLSISEAERRALTLTIQAPSSLHANNRATNVRPFSLMTKTRSPGLMPSSLSKCLVFSTAMARSLLSPAHFVFNDRRMIRLCSGPFQGRWLMSRGSLLMIASVTLSIIRSQSLVVECHKGLHLFSEKIVIFENLSLPDS